ncbi:MAG: LacI family transcriptional regulator [Rariglobus sp.]|jgi:DNA-binding LacI/PurR family transcriptional regulator|nr:LacI family transcriptional regulator [Rariglobus sp.]
MPQKKTPSSRPVTTRDVALQAGVAQSTVSRALSNNSQVSKAERERITAIAQKLGYRPNPFVSAFTAQVRGYRRSPQGAVIAFLDCTPSGRRNYTRYYLAGAAQRAQSLGYKEEVFRLSDLNGSVERLNGVLQARGITSLLVLPVPDGCDLSKIRWENLVCATIDYTLSKPDMHRASPDYFHGMQLALQQLEAQGRRRIVFCARPEEVTTIAPQWLGAFTCWQQLKPPAERMDAYCFEKWEKSHFLLWLKRAKPDGIITNSRCFLEWAYEDGFRPPEVSYVELNLAKPKLGYTFQINQNPAQVGAAAIDLIIGQIHRNERGLPALPKRVLVASSWSSP